MNNKRRENITIKPIDTGFLVETHQYDYSSANGVSAFTTWDAVLKHLKDNYPKMYTLEDEVKTVLN